MDGGARKGFDREGFRRAKVCRTLFRASENVRAKLLNERYALSGTIPKLVQNPVRSSQTLVKGQRAKVRAKL